MSNAIFMRPLPMTAISGSNTLAGYEPAYVANDYLGVVWKAQNSGAAAQEIILDLGANVAIDTVALIGMTGAAATWTLTISAATQAQGPFTGASFSWPAVTLLAGTQMPVSGRGRAYWEKPAGGPATARYWRITITTPANNTPVVIGRAVLGQRIVPERNFDFGAAFGVRDHGSLSWSTRAVMLRRDAPRLRSAGLSFSALYRDEVEGFVQPLLERVGITRPILIVTDTGAHAQRQNRIYFGPLIGELGTIWAKAGGGFQWQANIVDLEAFAGDS